MTDKDETDSQSALEVYYGDCPDCGEELTEEAERCEECGWEQEDDDSE